MVQMEQTIPEVAAAGQPPATDREVAIYLALHLANGAPMWAEMKVYDKADGYSGHWARIECRSTDDAAAWGALLGSTSPEVSHYAGSHTTQEGIARWRGWRIRVEHTSKSPEPATVDTDAARTLAAALESPAADEQVAEVQR